LLDSQAEIVDGVKVVVQGVLKKYGRGYFLQKTNEQEDTPELWSELGAQGLLGIGLPEEYGGSGKDMVASVAFVEAMSEGGVAPVAILANSFTRNAIIEAGTDEQRNKYLPGTATGEQRFAFALTEPDAGTNSFNIRTIATRDPDGSYILQGQKTYTSHLDYADAVVIVAKLQGVESRTDMGLFIVDLPAEGLTSQKMKINLFTPDHRFNMYLDGVKVPATRRLGTEGQGKQILFSALNPERLLIAAMCIGLGNHSIQKAVAYANVRAPFGSPIGSYQGVSHPLARAKVHLDAARALVYNGAEMFQAGMDVAAIASSAKLMAAEAAGEAIDACIQAFGGAAFDEDSDVSTLWPIIRLQRIAPINDQMVLNFIAERVLGLPRSY
jgi:acyl-CoA dehydrogenase